MKKYRIFLLLLLPFFQSCEESTVNLRTSTGNIGELIVVVNKPQWNGTVGESIKKHFQHYQIGLPQPEAILKIVTIPHKSFSKLFKLHRNILIFNIAPTSKARVEVKKDVWAKGQLVIDVYASSDDNLIQLLEEKGIQLAAKYQNLEINRLISKNKKFGDKTVSEKVLEKHQIKMIFQKGTYIATDSANFIWIRSEKERPLGGFQHQISQGILIYYYPYTDTSQFNPKTILAVRDSITKKHIPGPTDDSYMTVSYKMILPEHQIMNFKKNYAVETRGLWRVENNFMGGPFVNLTVLDKKNNRIITIDGYVYAPQFKKRDYVREVEAMIRSLRLE